MQHQTTRGALNCYLRLIVPLQARFYAAKLWLRDR
jgi:hypothetical protein